MLRGTLQAPFYHSCCSQIMMNPSPQTHFFQTNLSTNCILTGRSYLCLNTGRHTSASVYLQFEASSQTLSPLHPHVVASGNWGIPGLPGRRVPSISSFQESLECQDLPAANIANAGERGIPRTGASVAPKPRSRITKTKISVNAPSTCAYYEELDWSNCLVYPLALAASICCHNGSDLPSPPTPPAYAVNTYGAPCSY